MHGLQRDMPIANNDRNIGPDTFLNTEAYKDFLRFRENKLALSGKAFVDTAVTVHSDPMYYDAYRVAGDYCKERGCWLAAINYYQASLRHEVAKVTEREAIEKKIAACRKKI
jgi:hypothetical protein